MFKHIYYVAALFGARCSLSLRPRVSSPAANLLDSGLNLPRSTTLGLKIDVEIARGAS